MNRITKSSFRESKHCYIAKKDDRFKFAVTALTTLVTIVSAIILYIRNNAVDGDLFGYTLLLTPLMVVSIFFFIAYVVMKGISIGAEDSDKTGEGKITRIVYSSAFLMFIMILLLLLSFIIFVKYPQIYSIIFNLLIVVFILLINFRDKLFKKLSDLLHYKLKRSYSIARKKGFFEKTKERFNNFKYIFKKWNIKTLLVLYFLLIFIGVIANIVILSIMLTNVLLGTFLYNYIFPKQFYPKQYVPFIVAILFSLSLVLWIGLSYPISYFMKDQGQVTNDMNNIYYKNDSVIPVIIQLTGPNTGISIDLSQEDNGSGLILVDSIPKLEPLHNVTNVTMSDKAIMFGNSMENGKYNVFINTTNRRIGYYELNVTRYKFIKTSIKGFYLLNDSKSNYN